ncbi:MAG: Mg-protoporphyrin IX monomethyl ester oxidative cyclase [Saprospiraceae bacterium]|nr:MAG: Mg-protoporphyrin IX monomethyl ester oxidative cyclase [Saprospiraceae bacterium]
MKQRSVLLTHSYLLRLDPKQEAWHKPYPPLMSIQAAAMVRDAGYDVAFFDSMFADGPGDILPVLDAQKPDILVIFDDGFNYLTKMCLTNMREAAWHIAKAAQDRGCKVIMCGSDATDRWQDYLQNGIDYVLLGEGEATLIDLLNSLEAGDDLQSVVGLAWQKNGHFQRNANRPVMQDLDALPLPAWDLIDFKPYQQSWTKWNQYSVNIATTRGCPYKCNWCAKPIYGNSYKMRSPAHVIREIELLQANTSFDHIWFCDDIFGLKRSWVIEFAELVREKGLQLRYKIQSRADLLVKDQYIDALKASGCEEVWMGVESGAQEILDAMDKGITIEQIRTATHKLKACGIKPCFFIQFGYLNETAQHIRKTIALIKELLPHDIGISVSYPLPGTKFFEMVKNDLPGKTNWTDSEDLDLMFKNSYSSAFYKQLHHFVHQEFRKKHAQEQLKGLLRYPTHVKWQNLKKTLSILYYTPSSYLAKRQLKVINYEAASSL